MAPGTVKFWHSGVFKKVSNGETVYEGGRGRTFNVDIDELCWWDLEDLAKKCGHESIEGLYYLIPGQSLANGLRKVYKDEEVLKLAELVLKYRCVELYVFHGENYEWEDPRPESPLKYRELLSDISDEDDVDSNFEVEEGESDGELSDYVDNLELEVENEELLADEKQSDSDESDEEYVVARERIKSCNNKLFEVAQQLQREAAEGKLGYVPSKPTTGEGTSADGGYVSEYEDSEDDIHTPPDSGDEDLTVGRRRRRAVLVGEHTDFSVFQWKVGQRFPNRAAFNDAVAKYAVLQGRNLFIQASNMRRQQRLGVKCVTGCPFYVYASWDSRRAILVVKRVDGEHSCHRNMKRNRQLKTTWVAKQFLEVFKARPHWPASEIMETIRRAFKIVVKKEFAYKVKYAAHKLLHGSMHEHYKKVGGYVEALKSKSPGTMVEVVTDVSKQAFPPVFQRFYTCFEGLQKGWKLGCRKVIAVDACFLKTFLGGQLMSAIGRDGNDQMYPIAWAVVEGENNLSWQWFFLLLQRSLDLGEGEGIAIISDEHQAILNAVALVLPKAEHRHCARHIFAHWHKSYRGDEMKLLFWKIAKAYNLADYNDVMDELTQLNEDAATAFKGYRPEVFCGAFLDTSMKTDAITSNIAETFNGYIIQARTKHLIFMLEDIRNNLMQRLVVKRQQMEKSTSILCPRIQ
ncbi:uncharacterized protein [Spinacia oleracea]|uniref:MULE transposase domain-containing protein n=1 Tax=Spinacia oleracea TaxID=3562 RepID=A0ABM3R3N4_SPIOL|nr:uncharacterized protein LOC130465481 [Spinacia oleracea]